MGERDRPGRARRRVTRPADVVGELLPETTSDERDDQERYWQERSAEDWYRENRPPHHDGE
ncbi:hypothetical protein [Actinoalloteichus spitiensis]|uniref:hypothetical protein n=1 Tax=Actinoalloteichus spitiensis TaxID=252394 RepID=UPI00036FCDAE|nr:hypothetical protein [Actinoalloteichus spitiensis]